MKITIRQMGPDQIEDAAILFDAYRQFYQQESDLNAAISFLKERLDLRESKLFLAYDEDKAVGFTHLYPMFSSISMERSYILNDLYVLESARGMGAGKALLNHVQNVTEDEGRKGLALETYPHNPARRLYEREGWEEDNEYVHYYWSNQKRQ